MSVTPEGVLKAVIKAYLTSRKVASLARPLGNPLGYYRMSVPNGMGAPELDFYGCYKGRFFAVETKAFGNVPSALQKLLIKAHHDAGGFSIWGDDPNDLCKRLGEFFDYVDTFS